MLKKSTQTIVIALCTAAALIGLAFYQRYGGPISVSEATLYVSAAVICVLPAAYRLVRCKSSRNKAVNVG
jgi:hypothetical protein